MAFLNKLATSDEVWGLLKPFCPDIDPHGIEHVIAFIDPLNSTIIVDKQPAVRLDVTGTRKLLVALNTVYELPPPEIMTKLTIKLDYHRAPVFVYECYPIKRVTRKVEAPPWN